MNYFYLLRSLTSSSGLPALLFLVTDKCNAKCPICYYRGSPEAMSTADELTIKEIEKISRGIERVFKLIISGGEPFLREDLEDLIITFCHNCHVSQIDVTTNGFDPERIYSTTEKLINKLSSIPFNITVSLDALGAKHDQIRGIKIFDQAVETLKSLGKVSARNKNLKTGVNITLSHLNQENLVDTLAFAKEIKSDLMDVSVFRNNNINQIGIPATSPQDYKYCCDFINSYFSESNSHDLSRKMSLAINRMRRDIIYQEITEKRMILPCYAGTHFALLDPFGNLYPCDKFSFKLGNLRENNYEFFRLWRSEKADYMRKDIRNKRCFCTFECVIPWNIIANPRCYFTLLKTAFLN